MIVRKGIILNFWVEHKTYLSCHHLSPENKPYYFPLYWFFNREPGTL